MNMSGVKGLNSTILSPGWLRTTVYTVLALTAFAANSVICRLALGEGSIDAASFSTIRLVSGALVLMPIIGFSKKDGEPKNQGSWLSAAMLFLYAITFSFAYISLSTGTGALILFGAVQATMIIAGLKMGERLQLLQWVGLITALSGLFYLVSPGLEAPPLTGAALMAVGGISWGIYSLRGRNIRNPIAVTGDNFLRAVPMTLLISIILISNLQVSPRGALLAILSGALTSGIGYVIWYAALRGLTATRAASVQLLVPIIAAIGGVVFMSEQITLRLILATIMIIGGVGSTLLFKER